MPHAHDLTQLHLFRRQYLQALSPLQLCYPDEDTLRLNSTQAWLHKHVFSHGLHSKEDGNDKHMGMEGNKLAEASHDHLNLFAPPERYQLRVLKEVIGRIESTLMRSGTDDDVRFITGNFVLLEARPFQIKCSFYILCWMHSAFEN